jgi:hypothetical protein
LREARLEEREGERETQREREREREREKIGEVEVKLAQMRLACAHATV